MSISSGEADGGVFRDSFRPLERPQKKTIRIDMPSRLREDSPEVTYAGHVIRNAPTGDQKRRSRWDSEAEPLKLPDSKEILAQEGNNLRATWSPEPVQRQPGLLVVHVQ